MAQDTATLVLGSFCYSKTLLAHSHMFIDLSKSIRYNIVRNYFSNNDLPILHQEGKEYRGKELFKKLSANMGIEVSDDQLDRVVNSHRNCGCGLE